MVVVFFKGVGRGLNAGMMRAVMISAGVMNVVAMAARCHLVRGAPWPAHVKAAQS